MNLQVGANANQTISMSIGAMNASSLGGASGDVVSAETTGLASLTSIVATDLKINDQDVGAITGTTVQDAVDLINSKIQDFGAKASTMVEVTASGVGDGVLRAGTDTLTLALIDNHTNTSTFVITGTQNMSELVDKINSETGGSISATTKDGRLVLTADNASKLTVTDNTTSTKGSGITAGVTGTGDGTRNFSLVINDTSADKGGVKVEVGTAADVTALGLNTQDAKGNLVGSTATGGTVLKEGDLIINGVSLGPIAADATAAGAVTKTVDAINKVSDQTGVVAYASAAGTEVGLRSTTGDQISIAYGDNVSSGAARTNMIAMTGLLERNATSGSGSVASIDISTQAGAQKAIGVIDKALEQVNSTRGDLGAVNNRLDFTINNLTNVSQNATASRSRIEDADFAAETAALSRAQVLQQAGSAMLAQANSAPQQVLSLLR